MSAKNNLYYHTVLSFTFLCVLGVIGWPTWKVVFLEPKVCIAKSTFVDFTRPKHIAIQDHSFENTVQLKGFETFSNVLAAIGKFQVDVTVVPSLARRENSGLHKDKFRSVIWRILESTMDSFVCKSGPSSDRENLSWCTPFIDNRKSEIDDTSLDRSRLTLLVQLKRINPFYRLADFRNDPRAFGIDDDLSVKQCGISGSLRNGSGFGSGFLRIYDLFFHQYRLFFEYPDTLFHRLCIGLRKIRILTSRLSIVNSGFCELLQAGLVLPHDSGLAPKKKSLPNEGSHLQETHEHQKTREQRQLPLYFFVIIGFACMTAMAHGLRFAIGRDGWRGGSWCSLDGSLVIIFARLCLIS